MSISSSTIEVISMQLSIICRYIHLDKHGGMIQKFMFHRPDNYDQIYRYCFDWQSQLQLETSCEEFQFTLEYYISTIS